MKTVDNINISRASQEDLLTVSNLFDKYRQFYKQPADPNGALKYITERFKNNESVIFLASVENITEGFVQLYPMYSSISMKKVWVLNDMFVNDGMRNRGIGACLLSKVKEYAIETDAKAVVLETAPDNNAAQKLYETNGYVRDSEFFHYALTI